MQTLGIDLSTDPKKVWACEIDWGEAPPRVIALDQLSTQADPLAGRAEPPSGTAPPPPPAFVTPARTSAPTIRSEASLIAGLVERIARFQPGPDRIVGVDAPLGWPSAFVDAVADWDDGDLQGFRKRPDLRLRATDRFVQSITGVTPMSVSTDRMGSTAMLLAEVLSRVAAKLDRGRFERASAVDGVAEVHPPAALKLWTHLGGALLSSARYRSESRYHFAQGHPRELLLIELITSGIETGPEFGEAMLDSGDAMDAFLCALIARAASLGATLTPSASVDLQDIVPRAAAGPRGESIEQTTTRLDRARELQIEAQRTASAEGWIHLPRRADLSAALGLTPGAAQWVPAPTPEPEPIHADPYGRWSNGDGRAQAADPDQYGPITRFVGEDDADDASWSDPGDELVLVRRRQLDAGWQLGDVGR